MVLPAQGGAVPLCAARGVGTSGAGGKTHGSPLAHPPHKRHLTPEAWGRGTPPAGHTKFRHMLGEVTRFRFPRRIVPSLRLSVHQIDRGIGPLFKPPGGQGPRVSGSSGQVNPLSGLHNLALRGQKGRVSPPAWEWQGRWGCEMTWGRFPGQTPRRGGLALGVTLARVTSEPQRGMPMLRASGVSDGV